MNEAPKNINFLIVDDMTFTHSFMLQSLKKLSFVGNVFSSNSIKSSITKINQIYKEKLSIDLIIVDLHLSDGSGIELVKKIRSTKKLSSTPIIMMTTDENAHLIIEAFDAGVDNYFFKPIDDEILLQKINLCWKTRA